MGRVGNSRTNLPDQIRSYGKTSKKREEKPPFFFYLRAMMLSFYVH